MTDALPDPPQIDPAALAGSSFSRSRKGYDSAEVNVALGRAADALRTWELRDRQFAALVAELELRLSESQKLDEGRITAVLGEETARIVTVAREAAADTRSKAEARSAQILDEASVEAEKLRAESQTLLSSGQERHDELIAAAAAILEARTQEAEASAAALVEEGAAKLATAELEVEQLHSAAAAGAELELERAREEGRAMVAEAKLLRERMLADLAERRQTARRQIEGARAGRDRIIELLSLAGADLMEVVEQIDRSEDDVRRTAQSAAMLVDDDMEELFGDLIGQSEHDAQVETGVGESTEAAADDDAHGVATRVQQSARHSAGPDAGLAEIAEVVESTEMAEVVTTSVFQIVEGGRDIDDLVDDLDEVDSESGGLDSDELEEDDDDLDDDDLDDDDEMDVDEMDDVNDSGPDAIGGEESDVAEESSGATVHDLFARIRAGDGADDSEDESTAPDPAAAVAAAGEQVTTVGQIAEPNAGTAAAAMSDTDELSALLDHRDLMLVPIEKQLSRALRRLASDEQNEVLDKLRRVKKGLPALSEVVLDLDESTQLYSGSLRGDFSAAVSAGFEFWDQLDSSSTDRPVETDTRSEERLGVIVADFVAIHRAHLERAFTDAERSGLDASELADRIRATYRDLRSGSINELAGDLAIAGFAHGEMLAAGVGAPWRWVVDNGGLPCADGEDNALAGAIACEEPFPTGDVTPPAHAGCRCILVPAHR